LGCTYGTKVRDAVDWTESTFEGTRPCQRREFIRQERFLAGAETVGARPGSSGMSLLRW
jgi:hypothetical protein